MFRSPLPTVNCKASATDTSAQFLTNAALRSWQGLLGLTAELLAPPHCYLCQGPGQTLPAPWGLDLCLHCQQACPLLPTACPRCGLPAATPLLAGQHCADCTVRPPPYDAVFAAFVYDPPVDELVRDLKFHGALAPGRILGLLLAAQRRASGLPLPAVVIPMPLHRERLVSRGFNQATLIASVAARQLHLPLRARLLQRVRATAPQSGLSASARQHNLQGAFVARPLAGLGPVALVDDVLTTGSTAAAAARALKAAGASRVEVWVAARALTSAPVC
jgi:ComF family protein